MTNVVWKYGKYTFGNTIGTIDTTESKDQFWKIKEKLAKDIKDIIDIIWLEIIKFVWEYFNGKIIVYKTKIDEEYKYCIKKKWDESQKQDFIFDDIFDIQEIKWEFYYKAKIWNKYWKVKVWEDNFYYKWFNKCKQASKQWWSIAWNARKELENKSWEKIITKQNYLEWWDKKKLK